MPFDFEGLGRIWYRDAFDDLFKLFVLMDKRGWCVEADGLHDIISCYSRRRLLSLDLFLDLDPAVAAAQLTLVECLFLCEQDFKVVQVVFRINRR